MRKKLLGQLSKTALKQFNLADLTDRYLKKQNLKELDSHKHLHDADRDGRIGKKAMAFEMKQERHPAA